jgi:chromosome segregation ATPase
MLFLGSQSIAHILEVCDAFPEFIPLYEQVFSYQREVSTMTDVFYEALKIMNHNTEMYMIEELREKMQAEIDRKQEEIDRKQEEMQAKMQEEVDRHQMEKTQWEKESAKQQEQIEQLKEQLAAKNAKKSPN